MPEATPRWTRRPTRPMHPGDAASEGHEVSTTDSSADSADGFIIVDSWPGRRGVRKPMTTSQACGSRCGVSVNDGCTAQIACTCSLPETCGGGGTSGVCGDPDAGCDPAARYTVVDLGEWRRRRGSCLRRPPPASRGCAMSSTIRGEGRTCRATARPREECGSPTESEALGIVRRKLRYVRVARGLGHVDVDK